jgi:hypothetical protein
MKRHIATKVHTSLDHRAVIAVLGIGVAADDLGHHRQNITKAQSMEEPKDPGLLLRHTTTKTTKKRLEHCSLLAEFALHQYPKVANYLLTSKNMMDLRSHDHGS